MRFRFSDAKVKADTLLPPPGVDRVDHSDEVVQGLRLRVSKSGSRTFRLELWRGVDAQGRRGKELMTIGDARQMTVAEARKKAEEALRRRDIEGETLNVQRALRAREKASEAEATFGKAWARFMTEYVEGGETPLRPSTAQQLRHTFRRVEHWSPVPITKIRDVDVLAVLGKLRAEGKLSTMRLQRAYLSSFFGWALAERLIKVSPVPALPRRRRTAERKDASTILTVAQLRLILAAAGGLSDRRHRTYIETLVLTGARRFETASMHRDHVDLDRAVWTIPSNITKNGRAHTVHLAPQLVASLRELAATTTGYFFGTQAHGFSNFSRLKKALDKSLEAHSAGEVLPAFGWHDLRRSMASGMGDMGFAPHEIEAALNHLTGSRTQLSNLYNKSTYGERTKIAWHAWADRLENDAPANVVPLRA